MGAKVKPDTMAKVVAMRAAGYTVISIAEETSLSPSTIKRICKRSGTKRAEISSDLAREAKEQLIRNVAGDEPLRLLSASLIHDTMVQLEACREAMSNAGTFLKATNTNDALKVMRACASWSNALKLTADATRSALKIAPDTFDPDDLPELFVSVLTIEESEAERERQHREAIELGIISDDTLLTPS